MTVILSSTLLLFVRRDDEDHLVILGSGVIAQMAGQAELRPEGPLAVWTGDGGSSLRPVGTLMRVGSYRPPH